MTEYEDLYCTGCGRFIPFPYWSQDPGNPEVMVCALCGARIYYVEGYSDTRGCG